MRPASRKSARATPPPYLFTVSTPGLKFIGFAIVERSGLRQGGSALGAVGKRPPLVECLPVDGAAAAGLERLIREVRAASAHRRGGVR